MNAPRARGWPIFTVALVAAGVACEMVPRLADALRFERDALAAGQFWRFLSGHVVHGSTQLAAFDLLVLLVLGTWWEWRSRRALVAIVLASAILASTGVLVLTDLAVYLGSSALGSGLFVAAALELGVERAGWRRAACIAALALFVVKSIAEARGAAVFVDLPPGVTVSTTAHALGGLAGALVAIVRAFGARQGRDAAPAR